MRVNLEGTRCFWWHAAWHGAGPLVLVLSLCTPDNLSYEARCRVQGAPVRVSHRNQNLDLRVILTRNLRFLEVRSGATGPCAVAELLGELEL